MWRRSKGLREEGVEEEREGEREEEEEGDGKRFQASHVTYQITHKKCMPAQNRSDESMQGIVLFA